MLKKTKSFYIYYYKLQKDILGKFFLRVFLCENYENWISGRLNCTFFWVTQKSSKRILVKFA